jgi:ABC-type branched-subunit amino acid transport system substrate-binding protein
MVVRLVTQVKATPAARVTAPAVHATFVVSGLLDTGSGSDNDRQTPDSSLCACSRLGAFALPSASAAERPMVIGALYNLTGGQQDLDIPSSRGAKLAVDEANKSGGVLGRPVRLVLVDGQTNRG